jgi:hypothetical protein
MDDDGIGTYLYAAIQNWSVGRNETQLAWRLTLAVENAFHHAEESPDLVSFFVVHTLVYVEVEDQMGASHFPNLYIWMMSARVIDGHGAAVPYKPLFPTIYDDKAYRPFDNFLLPMYLMTTADHLDIAVTYFYSLSVDGRKRGWHRFLRRLRRSGLLF